MSLLRHPRPAGFVALLVLGIAAAGPALAGTGLQSEHDEILPQVAQADSADTQDASASSFDNGENGTDRTAQMGAFGHDHAGRGDGHGHGGGHGGGHGQ